LFFAIIIFFFFCFYFLLVESAFGGKSINKKNALQFLETHSETKSRKSVQKQKV